MGCVTTLLFAYLKVNSAAWLGLVRIAKDATPLAAAVVVIKSFLRVSLLIGVSVPECRLFDLKSAGGRGARSFSEYIAPIK
jgi:hypothetical protein